MSNKIFSRYSAIAFIIFGAFFVIESRKITASSYGSNVGPSIFPFGLGVILILLSLKLIYETTKYKKDEKTEEYNYKKMALVLAAVIIYIFIFEPLGYIISTFLFLTAMFLIMDKTKVIKSIVIALLFSVVVYYVYVIFFMGTLPPTPELIDLF